MGENWVDRGSRWLNVGRKIQHPGQAALSINSRTPGRIKSLLGEVQADHAGRNQSDFNRDSRNLDDSRALLFFRQTAT